MDAAHNVRSILLVDDESGVLLALKLLLSTLKFEVSTSGSGGEALERIAEGASFDLVLCDLRMPGMDGISLVRELRRRGVTTPFILMSGHATPEDVESALESGATSFLAKPFAPQQLTEALSSIESEPRIETASVSRRQSSSSTASH